MSFYFIISIPKKVSKLSKASKLPFLTKPSNWSLLYIQCTAKVMIIKIMRMKFAQLINYKQANATHKHILGKCGQCHFRNC